MLKIIKMYAKKRWVILLPDRKHVCRCGHKNEHHDPVDGRCNVIACGCWPVDLK